MKDTVRVVVACNRPPVATTNNAAVAIGLSVSGNYSASILDGSYSYDPDGLGDGEWRGRMSRSAFT